VIAIRITGQALTEILLSHRVSTLCRLYYGMGLIDSFSTLVIVTSHPTFMLKEIKT